MSNPNLPLIVLERGPWRAEVFDPRPDPSLLGARFVQGGWVSSLAHQGRIITGRCDEHWLSFDGVGLPETFESGLGRELVSVGDEYLRIGAGRIRKEDSYAGEHEALARLTTLLSWEVEQERDAIVFRTRDALKQLRLGYALERKIQLTDTGLCSTTTFSLQAEMSKQALMSWYAHPFFAQQAVDQVAYRLPEGCLPLAPARDPWRGERPLEVLQGSDGLWRHARANSREVFAAWGSTQAIQVQLPQPLGGGLVTMQVDKPLDHIVLWANHQVASPEPKIVRLWPHHERSSWSVTYRLYP